ncbi:MAG: hypothetical protein KAR45_21795 [Desulfobacteraceae bacterium]|nr:hypothetical protein [Desulfobacteraceae bacterium]
MDRYEALLKKLLEIGSFDMAKAAVDGQARIVGSELKTTDIVPDTICFFKSYSCLCNS